MLKVVQEEAGTNDNVRPGGSSLLDEIVRDGARRMLAAALQAEVAAYVEAHADQVDENGHRLVVRNGHHAAREVTTAAGVVPVRAPRVNDKRTDETTGERRRFSSAILPAWSRKSPRVAEVLPLLYLHGLSTSDFAPALEQFLGSDAGLSAATINRLTTQWQGEAAAFNQRSLAGTDYVYMWVDGIHLKVRLEQDKVCLLVMIGVRSDGRKELIALADGFRESTESWADLLRSAKRRGMTAPVLAVGDGALGFWAAVREVFPQTREQRCWFHKMANVLNALPKSAQPGAKAALAEIYNAEDREHATKAVKAFKTDYGREGHRRPRRAPGVLCLPRRALGPPAHHEPDRIDLRHRQVAATGHQGTRLTSRRCRDGVQAHRIRRAALESRQCTPPGTTRESRSHVPQGETCRTTRRPNKRGESRLKNLIHRS
jgi:putative transposase